MNHSFFFFCTLLLVSQKAFSYKHQAIDSILKNVEYVDNYDGDTITVNIPKLHPLLGRGIKIRIKGIDTAEIKGSRPCEKKIALYTKKFVKNLLTKARKIEIRNPSRGKYFRILADLWFDQVNLKEILLEENLAIPYNGKKKSDYNWCHYKLIKS